MENIAIKNYLLQHNVPCITPKAALIDMDGVLYDSMKNHVEAWYRTLTPMGFKCSKDEFYLYEGRTGASTIKYLFDKHFGKQVSDDECAEIYKIKEKHFSALEKIVPMPGADLMLQRHTPCTGHRFGTRFSLRSVRPRLSRCIRTAI